MKDMKELFAKKKKIGNNEKEAKMGVMKEISDMAGAAMGDKLKGLKKVSVMSDSKEGLEKGLDKAKDMVEPSDSDQELEDMESNDDIRPGHVENEGDEMPEGHDECGGCGECIDAKLAHLMKKKEELKA